MDEERRRAIEDELKRIEESATYSSQSKFAQAKLWQSVNLFVGLPAAVLAAISGGAALAGSSVRRRPRRWRLPQPASRRSR